MKSLVIALSVVATVAACSADATDFKSAGESLVKEVAEEQFPDLTAEASCVEPSSTDVGTTFDCTVTFSDGGTLGMEAKIVENDTVVISSVDGVPTGN